MQPTIFLTVFAFLTAANALAFPPSKRDAGVSESQVSSRNTLLGDKILYD
jgi:hypothetical protein